MKEPQYFKAYMDVKRLGSQRQMKWSGKRGELTKRFGWTIPNKKIIELLSNESTESPLVEIGAGNGYLSYEIQKNGGKTIPIDISPAENTWVTVKEMSYKELDSSTTSQIILPWPPANSSMGVDCIRYLKPNTVYFIGKPNSTVTGTEEFHTLLNEKYNCIKSCKLPSWTSKKTVFKKYIV